MRYLPILAVLFFSVALASTPGDFGGVNASGYHFVLVMDSAKVEYTDENEMWKPTYIYTHQLRRDSA